MRHPNFEGSAAGYVLELQSGAAASSICETCIAYSMFRTAFPTYLMRHEGCAFSCPIR